MTTVSSDTRLFGVNLLNDTSEDKPTNLGACVVPGADFLNVSIARVREYIADQVNSCPSQFTICTKQGWQINLSQEDQLTLGHIITEGGCVLIQISHDQPKIGVRDVTGSVIGFVFTSYSTDLQALKQNIVRQILQPQSIPELFQLLEGNKWPISAVQESHMTVSEILIGSCVHTNIATKQIEEFSPPQPPLKKATGVKDLSFRSGKDVCRTPGTNSTSKQVLISYVSVESASNALSLKQELAARGYSVYLDVHEIQSGVDWQDSLNVAVSECEVFIPLVTQKYGQTLWTNREVKLADVLGKYILPVNFLGEWPPRCLAIQFATTQYIPWIPKDCNPNKTANGPNLQWEKEDVKNVATRISERILKLAVSSTPSLVKRATIVKSCPCVVEDNQLAITSDREGRPLIMICVHPDQEAFAGELQRMFGTESFEVWCTSEIDRAHLDYLDGLASSQDGENYCDVLANNLQGSEYMGSIQTFQEKADDASVVLFVLSKSFSMSRTCQQQVFYCEHRKRVIPILFEEFQMPGWMSMLIGSAGLECRQDENFSSILIQRIKSMTDPVARLKRTSSNTSQSPTARKHRLSQSYDDVDSAVTASPTGVKRKLSPNSDHSLDSGANISPSNGDMFPAKRPSLSSLKTVIL